MFFSSELADEDAPHFPAFFFAAPLRPFVPAFWVFFSQRFALPLFPFFLCFFPCELEESSSELSNGDESSEEPCSEAAEASDSPSPPSSLATHTRVL